MGARKGRRERQGRKARKERRGALPARKRTKRPWGTWLFYSLGGVMALGLVLALVLPQTAGPGGLSRPGESIPNLGNRHIPSLDTPHEPYNSDPPTSGPHVEWIASWGVHDSPVPRELQVHNLEDGGVMVQYRPDASPEVVAQLKGIVERYRDRVILAPYPGLKTLVALTAWTRLLRLETVDEGAIRRFIDAYRGVDHHVR